MILNLLNTRTAQAQANLSTTTCPGSGCTDINVAQQGSIGIQITGTFVGTITFKGSVASGAGGSSLNFVDLAVIPSNSATPVTTTTTVGSWSRNIAGYTTVRVQFTAYTSGTAVVTNRVTLPSGNILSESGSGGAPDNATFVTNTCNASLSNEQCLSSLSSGIARVASTTGIVTSLTTSAGIATNISDETGTGVLTFATSPTFTTNINLGSAGVRLSDDGDGALTFLGLGNGSDEDLTLNLDDTSNTGVFSSSTGLTRLTYTSIGASFGAEVITGGTGLTVANVGANSCGTTAATVAGNSNAFAVTVGATGGTQCRVTFPLAASNRRHCVATDETTANLMITTYVDSTNTDIKGTMVAADVLSVICFAR